MPGRTRFVPGSLFAEERLGLDLDQPARVEEADDDPRRRGADVAEDLSVRAAGLADQRCVGDVDPCAYDVVRRRTGLGERGQDDLEAAPRLAVRVRGRVAAV